MKQFSVKHPVIFGIILIVATFAAAALITAVLASAGLPSETATTLSRILVGVILLFVFRETFPRGRAGRGLLWGLPALIFVLWNIVYHLSAGASFAGSGVLGSAFVAALAPAIFEEVLFRGILIGKLRENGQSPLAALLISAVIFGAVHLTNGITGDMLNVLVQVGYAFVVGLLFGAVYLKTEDLFSVMLFHFLIDFSSHLFVSEPTTSSAGTIAVFALVLLCAAVYSLVITLKQDPVLESENLE